LRYKIPEVYPIIDPFTDKISGHYTGGNKKRLKKSIRDGEPAKSQSKQYTGYFAQMLI